MIFELSKISQILFDLKEPEKRILKYLSLKGPMNQKELAKYTERGASSLDRWSLKKHLEGTTRFMGLIPYEYVSTIQHNKKETRYELTTKGILASIAIIPLKENITFKKYVDSVSNYLPSKGSNTFIKKSVTEFIKLLLVWHHIHGVNLTKQKYSANYYMEFFENIRKTSKIKMNHIQTKEENEFFNIMKNCITNFTVIDLLSSGKLFKSKSLYSVVDWKKTKSQKENTTDEYSFAQFLWQWPYFLGNNSITLKSQQEEPALSKYYAPSITQTVNQNLAQIEAKIRWKSELDSSTRKLS